MLKPIAPCIDYLINQDYIAEFLCINKDKPKFQCNGKCHLAKQIAGQELLKNVPNENIRLALEQYPIGFVQILEIEASSIILSSKNTYFRYLNNYNFQPEFSCFHPPIIRV